MFAVFRELQAVLSEEREMGVKIMSFCRGIAKESITMDSDQLGVSCYCFVCCMFLCSRKK